MTRGSHSMYYCKRCLNGFTTKDALYNHKNYCNEQNAVRVVLLKPDTMLSFKNYNRSMRVPFVVYADFESCIKHLILVNLKQTSLMRIKFKNTYLSHFAFM